MLLSEALITIDALDSAWLERAQRLIGCARSFVRKVDALIINITLAAARKLRLSVGKLYILCQNNATNKRASAGGLASLVCALSLSYEAVLVDSSSYWHDIICRASAILNAPMLSNVCAAPSTESAEFARNVYAGRLTQILKCGRIKPLLLSVDVCSFNAIDNGLKTETTKLQLVQHTLSQQCKLLKHELPKQTGLPSLCDANIVIAGGKAFGSAEMFNKYLQPLASRLNAAVGASRSAVDAGFAPIDCQIGQSGKTIAPKLYIAFGISGSDHHMVGVKDSKSILAVNTDSNAPITKLADYTIVANMFEVIPRLLSVLPRALK